MPGRALDYLRRLNAPREVEDSLPLRIAVWAAVCISLVALSQQGVTSPRVSVFSITLLTLGYVSSWWRRYRPNIPVKLVIMGLTLAALVSFLRQVYLQPYDPRIPLAELFVWVQVLHSFDLPRAKDLLLSLVSSLILMALAGSYALSASYGLVVLAWLSAALPALYFIQHSRLCLLSSRPQRAAVRPPTLKGMLAMLSALTAAIALAGLAVGAFMPRVNASYLRSLPFSLRRAAPSSGSYAFSNPGYPGLPFRPPENPVQVNPEAYFGFSPYLDLRVRGRLADGLVMKVRSTEPAYWRGMSFVSYNGYSWLAAEEEPERLRTPEQPFEIEYPPAEAHLGSRSVIQTFYVEREQPSVVFAAFRPATVYFPADFIYRDASGLKSPFELDQGLVYSVISSYNAPGDRLAASTPEVAEGASLPYLELPPLPERVVELAREIVPAGAGPFQRALAIEDYLRENYRYSLDVPPLPRGRDAVDHFLFDAGAGYCEHFASAYAVLCRLAGIPARVVTGYSTGEYNPFTGLYEVRLRDAHAWVEIYLEGIGWVTREPTPSFSLPDPGEGSGGLWVFGEFFSWVGRSLSALFPPALRSAAKGFFSALVSGASALASGFLYSVREAPWAPLILALLLSALPCAGMARRRKRSATRFLRGGADGIEAMRGFLQRVEGLGISRSPSQTAEEFAAALRELAPGLDIARETELFERVRYGADPLDEEELRLLRKGLDAAARILESRSGRVSHGLRRLRSRGAGDGRARA
ncbi:MAG: transglutaminase domain-containing protein [Actinobacteria bacterium]|nr:transglutaminase domain-containing protein [Actinomycetota bacterium]MDI6830743.1 DUF3488 and transglutaminase-like domain-containing protein [Actinomycetota bacterium]